MTKTILKSKILTLMAVSIVGGILIGSTFYDTGTASAQEGSVPDWFRGVAGFWAEEKIETSEFLNGIEFLLENEIISVSGYGPITEAQAQSVDQESLDELWGTINSLQQQIEEMREQTDLLIIASSNFSVTSEMIADETIRFSDIHRNGCGELQTMVWRDSRWQCMSNTNPFPDSYVKVNTDKGTAVVSCDAPSFHTVIGGGGIPEAGTTLEKSFPTGLGAFGISKSHERPTGWAASSSDVNADVSAFVVCLKPRE